MPYLSKEYRNLDGTILQSTYKTAIALCATIYGCLMLIYTFSMVLPPAIPGTCSEINCLGFQNLLNSVCKTPHERSYETTIVQYIIGGIYLVNLIELASQIFFHRLKTESCRNCRCCYMELTYARALVCLICFLDQAYFLYMGDQTTICIDIYGLAIPPNMAIEWCATVPFIIYAALSLEYCRHGGLSPTYVAAIIATFFMIATGCLTSITQTVSMYMFFMVTSCCLMTVPMYGMYVAHLTDLTPLSSTTSHGGDKQLRAARTILLPALAFLYLIFPLVAALRILNIITVDTEIITLLILGVCTKKVFLNMTAITNEDLVLVDYSDEISRHNETVRICDTLSIERRITTKLLQCMMPPKIASDLSNGFIVPPEVFRFTVIFFSDIEGFTRFSSGHAPLQVFNMLDKLFGVMDHCVSKYPKLYKVETIGDAYMVVGGILEDLEDESTSGRTTEERDFNIVHTMTEFALDINEVVQHVDLMADQKVRIRIGLHCGPVVAGLSGKLMPRYCLFGDTVNVASRMESTGVVGSVQISCSLAEIISKPEYTHKSGKYALVPRNELVEVKGKGMMKTFFLETSK